MHLQAEGCATCVLLLFLRCVVMEKFGKQVIIYMDAELRSWLDAKVKDGYKMGSFIRYVLKRQMDSERQKPLGG